MADEALAKAGLHFDELNKIRVLEPEVSQQTTELKEECKDFLDSKYDPIHCLKSPVTTGDTSLTLTQTQWPVPLALPLKSRLTDTGGSATASSHSVPAYLCSSATGSRQYQ